MILVRGFAQLPEIPSMGEIFKLRPACIATYPMYRGVSRLVGMEVIATGTTVADEVKTLEEHWSEHDFFFFHVKKTDSAGEDGNFEAKTKVIEEVDRVLPAIRELGPDAMAVTGDHSTPSLLKAHSWHPLPVLIWSRVCRPDAVSEFHEAACAQGNLGHLRHTDILPLLMANAGKFLKYGA
jgi:2,3-bisphosphoglycerate-independent phosphoglycerate mutase